MQRSRPTAEEELADAVLGASRVLVAIAAQSLAEVSDTVTLPQFRALVVLQSRGPQPLHALADELAVVPSTATRMCDRLEAKGLLTRTPHPDDRRAVTVRITPAGARLVSAVSRRRHDAIRHIVTAMPAGRRAGLVAALEAFSAAAGEVPERQWHLGWS